MRGGTVKAVLCFALGAMLGAGAAGAIRLSLTAVGDTVGEAAGDMVGDAVGGAVGTVALETSGIAAVPEPRPPLVSPQATPPTGSDGDDSSSLQPGALADSIVRVAASQPQAALARALAIEPYWHRLDTVERIASLWGGQDPEAALAFALDRHGWSPALALAFETGVIEEWARTDPLAVLDYLMRPEQRARFLLDRDLARLVARAVAARVPHELLDAADRLSPGLVRSDLRAAAIEQLAAQDLDAALARYRNELIRSDRQQWIETIAAVLVERDPVAALDWARQADASVSGTFARVAAAVSAAYPERRDQLDLCHPSGSGRDCAN